MERIYGLLLVNLGTPKSPRYWDVIRYLNEFLMDERVIDLPKWKRHLLVQGIIIPSRFRASAKAYTHLWTPQGSPLLVYGKQLRQTLSEKLGNNWVVALAMRYQEPSLANAVRFLLNSSITDLILFPLFPQYASATTGSIYQELMRLLSKERAIPRLHWIHQFSTHPAFLHAWKQVAAPYLNRPVDQILFSYHGLPRKHLHRTTPRMHCHQGACCHARNPQNHCCYVAQCTATTAALTALCQLPKEKVTQCFQSRLGKDPWTEPFTQQVIEQLAAQGSKEILIFCPSFVADCLETTVEIGIEMQNIFRQKGGRKLHLIPSLNTHPAWVDAIVALAKSRLN